MTTFRDNGFELPIGPPRIDYARNSYVYQYDPKIMPKKSAIDYLIEAFKAPFKPQPKRKHAITVRKLSGWYGSFWKFSCTPCGLSINYPTWETAYRGANHHAHNHH